MLDNELPVQSAQAARVLGVSKCTMATWRNRGTGPPVHYSGTKPVYYVSELHAWQDESTAAMRQKQADRAATSTVAGRKRGRPKGSIGLVGGRHEAVNA